MAASTGPSARRVRPGPEARPVTGNDHGSDLEDPGAAAGERSRVWAERVVRRAGRGPPRVGADVGPVGGGGHGADVLLGVARRGDQPDRWAQLGALGFAVDPQVPVVSRPVVVHAGIGEQRGVDRVIGMMVAEYDVGDLAGRHARPGSTTTITSPSMSSVTELPTRSPSSSSRT